jgi:hypothetical protein
MIEGWFKINDPKNSDCDSCELSKLDWDFWFSDDFFKPLYIHVGRKIDNTTHRVYPKKKDIIGLAYKNKDLYWIQKAK